MRTPVLALAVALLHATSCLHLALAQAPDTFEQSPSADSSSYEESPPPPTVQGKWAKKPPAPLPKWKRRPPPPPDDDQADDQGAHQHSPGYIKPTSPPTIPPPSTPEPPSPPSPRAPKRPKPPRPPKAPRPPRPPKKQWAKKQPPSPPNTPPPDYPAIPEQPSPPPPRRPKRPAPWPKWKKRPPPPSGPTAPLNPPYPSIHLTPLPGMSNTPALSPDPPPAPPAPPAEPVMDIWIQAGGSNTWGDNGAWDGDWVNNPPCTRPRPEIKMWSIPNQTWTDAVKNVHTVGRLAGAPSDTLGVDIPFARALLDLGLSKEVGFVPCAMPGTSMFANWQPSNQDQFPKMINQTRLAMQSIGKKGRLAGMVMMLGEGDAMLIYNTISAYNPAGTVWSSYFGLLMSGMIQYMRLQLQDLNPNLPVIISLQAVKNRDRVYPWIESIRNQTQSMNMTNLVKADMEGCRIYQINMASWNGWLGIDPSVGWQGIHLSRTGQCCMGQRMAVAYARAKGNFTLQGSTGVTKVNQTLLDSMSLWPMAPLLPPLPPPAPPPTPPLPPNPPPPPMPPLPPPPPNYTRLAEEMLNGKRQ